MVNNKDHKPVIETMINTAALAVTAFGVNLMLNDNANVNCFVKGCLIRGCILILIGALLEFFKYWGRKHQYW